GCRHACARSRNRPPGYRDGRPGTTSTGAGALDGVPPGLLGKPGDPARGKMPCMRGRHRRTLTRGLSRPMQALAASTFVNAIGSGLYLPSSVLFFTRSVHLSAARVGLGLTLAATLGMSGGFLLGQIADRFGPRGSYVGFLVLQGASMAAYLFVHSFGPFVALATINALTERG